MKTMKCNQCGKELEAQTYWYGEVLQVLWYCEEDKCGFVSDVYFTGNGAPSPFADANLTLGDMVEEEYVPLAEFIKGFRGEQPLEGCPTDEAMQLMQDAADQEDQLNNYLDSRSEGRGYGWSEGRGYGDFDDADRD